MNRLVERIEAIALVQLISDNSKATILLWFSVNCKRCQFQYCG